VTKSQPESQPESQTKSQPESQTRSETRSETESETESACKYCTKWRSFYRKDVGDFIIIRRILIRPRPKENCQHTHISIYTSDFGKPVGTITRGLFSIVLIGSVIALAEVNSKHLEKVAISLALIAIVLQALATVLSLKNNPRPSYGKALSSLYGARASSECVSSQKQYLNDAALELYSIDSCKRADFLKLLEWINCRDRTTQEFTEFGEKLIELLCEHHSRYLFRRIKKALLLSR
jgi:hypothetical protein